MWQWIQTVTGSNNTSGTWYGFWSGFGSDLGLFTAIGVFYYKHSCHRNHCYRIAKHTVKGSPYCTKHLEGVKNGQIKRSK